MQTGIMLSLVDPEIRPQATALSNIMYNAIGYFPAPFVYGLIQQNTGGKLSKWGMIFTMSMLIPTALLMACSMYYKPDMKEYWEERKKELLQQYMQQQSKGITEKLLADNE
jgi:hypothetical protein